MGRKNSRTKNGFWARQTKRDRITIVSFGVEIGSTLILGLISVFVDDATMPVGIKLALLSLNVLALVSTLQFSVNKSFDAQDEKIESIEKDIKEMANITTLGETYIKIYKQDEGTRSVYLASLENALSNIGRWIDDKRSGSLDLLSYYNILGNAATRIKNDFCARRDTTTYQGEIWALTFCLEDEWDDDSPYERIWFETLKELDALGIKTRRLWAFSKKMNAELKKDPPDDDIDSLLNRFKMYCSKDTYFKNTKSFALNTASINQSHINLFGKGFFAIMLDDKQLALIRGVCFDNLASQNSLGGEVDYDTKRIADIRKFWEQYLNLAIPLNKYLYENSCAPVRDKMKGLGFDIHD